MKLHNKKTGEIIEIENIAVLDDYMVLYQKIPIQGHTYYTFAELNEEWEDVRGPLIKDEKIRKAVRAWAEALGVTKVYVCGIGDGKEYIKLYAQDNGVTDGRIRISIPTQDGVWIGKEYIVEELCGEEEE